MKNNTINRRQFLYNLGEGALIAILGGSLNHCSRKGKRPNFIFLLTDDQRWDTLGVMGNSIVKTPNMDQLARQGIMFSNAYVTTAICCTSRASIFLGQYARRHGINDFSTDFSPQQLELTYDMQLKKAGYQVGFIGKYGVGTNLPAERYDYWKGIGGQPIYEHLDENGQYKHLTQILGEQSIEFLNNCSPDKPFCLSVSFKAPHVQDNDPRQFIYDPIYKDLYQNVTIPVPVTADDRYFYEKFPAFFTDNNEARRRWHIRFSTPQKYQESVKGYYRLITGVDKVIGDIRKELEKLGQDQHTIILLSGDNGFYLGEHGLAGKWYGHEESIRVPLIVYDPFLPEQSKGKIRSEKVLNIDIAPTILDLAGLPVAQSIQGTSLKPLLEGKSVIWRNEFFYEHLFHRAAPNPVIPKSEGVVSERFKYLRYFEQDPVFEELYDLKNDPHEINNLVTDANYFDVLSQFRKKCDHYSTSLL
jgi:arylsulfatase A-like enzyme